MYNKKIYVTIFLFFLAIFVFFSSGHYGGDGLENYLVAQSIVKDGDLSIHDAEFGVKEMKYQKRGKIGSGGKIYSTHGLGMPILLVPLYFLGSIMSFFVKGVHPEYVTQLFVSFANPIMCAGLSVVFILLLSELKYSMRISFISTLIFSFCTMSVVYSRSGFSEPAVTLCFLIAAFFTLRYLNTGLLRYILYSGFFSGYPILIKKTYLIYIICFVLPLLVYGYKEKNVRKMVVKLAIFAIPLVIYLLIILGFNYVRYEGIFNTEYGTVSDVIAKVSTPHKYFKAFFYFFFSSGKGFFFFNIPLILFLFGVKDFCRRNKVFSFLVLSIILLNFSFHIYLFDRGTLFSWGPRYLYLSIPFFAVFLAHAIHESKYFSGKLAIWVLAIMGFLVQLPSLFINNSRWLFFLKEKLNVDEYMINYVPDLSPIKGTWYMCLSCLYNVKSDKSLAFGFDPDHRFITPANAFLSGYDSLDIWWFHALKVHSSMMPFVLILLVFIIGMASFTFYKIVYTLKMNDEKVGIS